VSDFKSPIAGTRPEIELLLCCVQSSVDSQRVERIAALLQEDLDWVYLIQTALQHGVMPLLYQSLVTTGAEAVPAPILDQLRCHFRSNARRNLRLVGQLLRCLKLLGAHGIPAAPYKGPVLAASVYGDLCLRQFVDLDVLVHEQDAFRARDVLASHGYRPEFQLAAAQEVAYLRSQSAHQVIRDAGMVIVELHWRITEGYFSFPLDTEQLWKRLEPASLAGREVRTLSAEDLLLVLCVHGTKHMWERLEWICDVAKLVGMHAAIDWPGVMKQAATLGSERMLFLGLSIAHDLLCVALPREVLESVRADPAVATLAGQVYQRLFSDQHALTGDLERCLFHLKARERFRDRLLYCLRLAMTTTPEDWALVPLPSSLFPLYYVLRPIRLAGKYGPALLRRSL
jgi:hypothetical protein